MSEITVSNVEVVEAPFIIAVELTQDQFRALKKLDLLDDAQEIVEKSFATALRGKFKYMAEKAQASCEASYDAVANMGVKMDTDKGAYVSKYMNEVKDILKNL